MKKRVLLKHAVLVSALACGLPISQIEAQVKLPQVDDSYFAASNIQVVMDGENEVALLTKEYVLLGQQGSAKYLIYLPKADRAIDLSIGYDTKKAGSVSFDSQTGKAKYTTIDPAWKQEMYITADGKVSYTKVDGARNATIKPMLLTDKRGAETERYATVKLGNQIWLRENLRATAFRDGTAITTGLTKKQWEETKSAALTYYDNNVANRATMGALYNWYAATDERGLAPKGWKVPERKDWEQCIKYLDFEGFSPDPDNESVLSCKAGKDLKSTIGWIVSPTGKAADLKPGTNVSMMDMHPYGSTSTSKYLNGYSGKGLQAYFWTGTQYEYEATKSYFVRFYWDSDVANSYFEDKFMGYSVRCVAAEPLRLAVYIPTNPTELSLNIAKAGTLSEKVNAEQIAKVTKLTVGGELDARDFATIRRFAGVRELNLDNIRIVAYKGDKGTLNGVKQYRAEEIPAEGMARMAKLATFKVSGTIKAVGGDSFVDCVELSSVSLPTMTTELGGGNFRGCTALRTIALPESLIDLGYGSFEGCTTLSAIRFSGKVVEFGDKLFKGCRSLSAIAIPAALETIGTSAFEGCSALREVKLPATVAAVGSFAFTGCATLETVVLSKGTKEIEYGAFLGCAALKSLTLPEGFETIGAFSLQGCTALAALTIPVSTTKIGNGAFRATNITFTLPEGSQFKIEGEGLMSRDGKVFYYVPSRFKGKMVVPEGVETINGAAFADCKGLAKIDLPASIRELKVAAFENTTLYEAAVRVADPKSIKLGEDVFGKIDPARCVLYVPDASFALYQAATPWNQFKLAKMSTPVQAVDRDALLIRTIGDGRIMVSVPESLIGQTLRVIDLTGKVVLIHRLDRTETILETATLARGIYLASINGYVAKICLR